MRGLDDDHNNITEVNYKFLAKTVFVIVAISALLIVIF